MFCDKRPLDCVVFSSTLGVFGLGMCAAAVATTVLTMGVVSLSALSLIAGCFAAPCLVTAAVFTPLFSFFGPNGKDYLWKSLLYQTAVFAMTCVGVGLAVFALGLFTMPLLITYAAASLLFAGLLGGASFCAYSAFKGSTTPICSIADVYDYMNPPSDKVE